MSFSHRFYKMTTSPTPLFNINLGRNCVISELTAESFNSWSHGDQMSLELRWCWEKRKADTNDGGVWVLNLNLISSWKNYEIQPYRPLQSWRGLAGLFVFFFLFTHPITGNSFIESLKSKCNYGRWLGFEPYHCLWQDVRCAPFGAAVFSSGFIVLVWRLFYRWTLPSQNSPHN